jgi:hypothetical protein
MDQKDRVYYAERAAEELERALAATDAGAAEVHRKLQRAYLERASVGDRPIILEETVG